ncbi:MAG: flagellar basal body P-ring protein FlgI [Nitrospinae bacterium]|nr:flagellar basal body P-ring protein FlgI [Nitrospinota bacterium]
MKPFKIRYILSFLFAALFLVTANADAARLKDISSIKGVRNNQLFGYGIITGLMGTGDGNNSVQFMIKSMISMLQRMGINTPAADVNNLKMKNVAAVMITATLPPFAKAGSQIDVQISSIGDAKSLKGGVLLISPLKAANGEVYAVAQGPLTIGGEGSTQVTTARIPNGAIVEREIPSSFFNKEDVTFLLKNPDFSTAQGIMEKVNKEFGVNVAHSLDSSTITINIPPKYRKNAVSFVSMVENLEVPTNTAAKVIIDEQTGTVVISDNVKIMPIAVSHGELTLVVKPMKSEKDKGKDKEEEKPKKGEEEKHNVFVVDKGESIQGIAKALSAVGATPKDLMAIFQAIKASGALQGELEIL